MTDNNNNNGITPIQFNVVVPQRKIKIEQIEQAYALFVSALKYEPEEIRGRKHFWVMGIDPVGYVNCIHTILYGTQDIRILSSLEILQDATNRGCTSVIVAHDRFIGEDLKPNEYEIDNATWLYHYGRHMDVKVLDYLVLNLDGFFSFNKDGLLKSIQKNMKYKTYTEVKPLVDRRIDKIKKQSLIEGERKKAIEVIKNLLALGITDTNILSKATDTCLKDIQKVKKEMKLLLPPSSTEGTDDEKPPKMVNIKDLKGFKKDGEKT